MGVVIPNLYGLNQKSYVNLIQGQSLIISNFIGETPQLSRIFWGVCMKITTVFLFVFFSSLAGAQVFINDYGYIEYQGDITESKNNIAFSLLGNSGVKPSRLIISSPGGAVDFGMQLGEWVHKNKLDVEVGKYCMSSCANYVFIAGKNKFLRKHSFIGWHGGLLQRRQLPFHDFIYLKDVYEYSFSCDLSLLKGKYSNKIEFPIGDNHLRECTLIRDLGVDYRIMILGQYSEYYDSIREMGLWSYSYEALEALGVKNIVMKDGVWQPPLEIRGKKIFYFDAKSLRKL